jgi:regulator of sigma E protease
MLFAFGRYELEPRVSSLSENMPAERAGLLVGDLILEIDGRTMETFTDIRRVVSLATGNELKILVDRDGERISFLATPERTETPDGLGGTQRIGMLGIGGAGSNYVLREFGIAGAAREAVEETGAIIEGTLRYLGRIVAGRESADQLSGPAGIVKMSGDVAERGGGLSLVQLAAILSVSIGLLNLFPIPMLDGGHLMFYAYEAVAGRPLDAKTQEIAFRFGFALIIMLFLFVTYNDISIRFMAS